MFELKLENEQGDIVNIDDGIKYIITDISGENPPSALLFTSKSPNRKGVKYNASTLNERIVMLTVKLLGDVEKNRNDLYAWIDTEQYVKIHYKNGIKNVYCEGHIQDCDFTTFTDNESINLVIVCEDPYWKDLSTIVTEISNLLKEFTFPFSIDEPIPFSSYLDSSTTSIFNSGVETGVKFIIRARDEVNKVTIFDSNDVTKKFEINYPLTGDETIEIDTDGSPKTVKLIKANGETENILRYVSKNPTWFSLKKGDNKFGYTTDTSLSSVELTIAFTNKYLGV